jgi:hypothetical protein
MLKAQAAMALAKGDVTAANVLTSQMADLRNKQVLGAAYQRAMQDPQLVDQTLGQFNSAALSTGHPQLQLVQDKNGGWILRDGKDNLKLDDSQKRDFFANLVLMSVDPSAAKDGFDKIHEALGAQVDSINKTHMEAGQVNNQALGSEAKMLEAKAAGARLALDRQRMLAPQVKEVPVNYTDPASGKVVRGMALSQIAYNPQTNSYTQSFTGPDGKPLDDSTPLGRAARGYQSSAEATKDALRAQYQPLLDGQAKMGDAAGWAATQKELQQKLQQVDTNAQISELNNLPKEQQATAVSAILSSGISPDLLAGQGVDPSVIQQVQQASRQQRKQQLSGGLAAPSQVPQSSAQDAVHKAYDDWQNSKQAWYQQQTPTSAAAEAALKQRFEDLYNASLNQR